MGLNLDNWNSEQGMGKQNNDDTKYEPTRLDTRERVKIRDTEFWRTADVLRVVRGGRGCAADKIFQVFISSARADLPAFVLIYACVKDAHVPCISLRDRPSRSMPTRPR